MPLERLGFEKLVNETLTVRRIPRVMTIYQFVLGMVLAIYVGFARLNHLRFVAQDLCHRDSPWRRGHAAFYTCWRSCRTASTGFQTIASRVLVKVARLSTVKSRGPSARRG